MNIKFLFFLVIALGSFNLAVSQINYESIELEFSSDTTKVEKEIAEMLDKDYSTLGMIEVALEYERKYDILLNKYYKLLSSKLTVEGRRALQVSQRNWIKFRDSEKALISEINNQTYDEAGGGTIWGVITSNSRAEITKKRVVELYNYLMYGYIGG